MRHRIDRNIFRAPARTLSRLVCPVGVLALVAVTLSESGMARASTAPLELAHVLHPLANSAPDAGRATCHHRFRHAHALCLSILPPALHLATPAWLDPGDPRIGTLRVAGHLQKPPVPPPKR